MQYVQYGCGLSAPEKWLNFDSSPTLRIQNLPVVGSVLASRLNVAFPKSVRYGDIVKGLPIESDSCDGVYCSHVLEHLSFDDFHTALRNTRKILRPGATFRLVMPDLAQLAQRYIDAQSDGDVNAGPEFIRKSGMALERRPSGAAGALGAWFGSARHQWLWDGASTQAALSDAGFTEVRRCEFGDADDPLFSLVEDESRFKGAVAIEARH